MSVLQKVCCFFLLGKMLLYLCPDQKYEAYYGLLLQWTLLAILILPLLAKGEGERMLVEAQEMWETWQDEMGKVREGALEEEVRMITQETTQQYIRLHRDAVEEMYGEEAGKDDTGLYGDETEPGVAGIYGEETGQDSTGLYEDEAVQENNEMDEENQKTSREDTEKRK